MKVFLNTLILFYLINQIESNENCIVKVGGIGNNEINLCHYKDRKTNDDFVFRHPEDNISYQVNFLKPL